MTKYLHEHNSCGPCITLGEVVSETPHFWVVQTRFEGKRRYRKGRFARNGLRHVAPCALCMSHPHGQYAGGYWD